MTWALSLFRTSSYTARLNQLSTDPHTKTLFIYGDSDQFTKLKVRHRPFYLNAFIRVC